MIEIRNDNYINAFKQYNFMLEEAYNQASILAYTNECICLERGDFHGIQAINESFADNVKNIIAKLWKFLQNIFAKFRERVGELFTTDKKFLEKYKDTILKNSFKSREITDMYNYQPMEVKAFFERGVPKFDLNTLLSKHYNDQGTDNKAYDEEMFIADNQYLSEKSNTYKNCKNDVEELTKAILHGGEDAQDTIDMTALNRDEMYKFCIQYDNVVNLINKNASLLRDNENKINGVINNYSKSVEDIKKEGFAYSEVYGRIITEEEGMKVQQDKKNNTGGNGSSESIKTDFGSKIQAGQMSSVDDNKQKAEELQKGAEAKKGDELDKEKKKVQWILEACKEFFSYSSKITSNMLTIVMAMYKNYMKILRIHVRDYLGNNPSNADNNITDGASGSGSSDNSNGNIKMEEVITGNNAKTHDIANDGTMSNKYNFKADESNLELYCTNKDSIKGTLKSLQDKYGTTPAITKAEVDGSTVYIKYDGNKTVTFAIKNN